MRLLPAFIAPLAALLAVSANARDVEIAVPAGKAGDAAVMIAQQTGSSVVITDRALAKRRVPAIRGTLSAEEAIQQLASAANATAVRIGQSSWRLVPVKASTRRAAQPPRKIAAIVTTAAPLEEAAPEPIVVIGSKRDTRIEDYPGHLTMVDGEELTIGGVGGTEKLARRMSSLTSTHLGSGRNKLFIRGIADSSFTGPTQSTVGQYFGDLRLSYNAPDPDLRLSDLERVEVLEGPQGALYGAGSLGGIIRLVPNLPEPGFASGSAAIGGSATQHGALGADASAVINLPVAGDVAALRLNIDADSQGGYIDKPLLGRRDVNRTDTISGRAALRVDAGGGWFVDMIAIGKTTDGDDSQYADRDGPPLSRAASVTEGFAADYVQGQLVVSGELADDILIRSSTGLSWQSVKENYDATAPDGPERIFVQANDTDMIANETRVWKPLEGDWGWLVGASYVHNRSTLNRSFGAPDDPLPSAGVRNAIDELTLYGEASKRLGDILVASFGGRFTASWLGGSGTNIRFFALTPESVRLLEANTSSRRETAFLPAFSIVATPLDKTSLYFRYQEGFRPGGLAVTGDYVSRFLNDHVSTIEIGGRYGRQGRGDFNFAANVSFTRWKDIQADFIDPVGLPSTANIGDGRILAATISAGFQITDALRLDSGFTVNDSDVDKPVPEILAGPVTQIPNIAAFTGRFAFEYVRPVGRDLEFTANGWAQFIGRSRLGVGPELGESQGNYFDSGVDLRLGNDRFGLSLGVSNLTDETGNRFALGTPFTTGRAQITPLRPRTLRLGIDASF
ncbi:TonB-dependent receptor domain-containing protein [Altererythrobacter sp. Z27]|uniref:TonB-dependent receptor domain-containing protein n=1 Tax=Altererythrobacter sp. Z27 TaxID=3461147 RepID=UPI00404403AE